MESYFAYLSKEVREIILSYLDYTSLDNYNSAYGGWDPEELAPYSYDILNVFKIKYPYVFSKLNLKRNISTDILGFEYDVNEDLFMDYLIIGRGYPELEEYMITGNGNYEKLDILLKTLVLGGDLGFNKDILTQFWVDITRKLYPRLTIELNEMRIKDGGLNEDDFIIMLNTLEGEMFNGFIKDITNFDINNFFEIDDYLPGFLYDSAILYNTITHKDMSDKTFGKLYALYLIMILKYYTNNGLPMNSEISRWLLSYIHRNLS